MGAAPANHPGTVRRIAAATAGAAALAALVAGAWYGYRAVADQPVKRVVFTGDLERLRHGDLDALSRAIQDAAPGAVTLESAREAVRRIAWVRDAAVRRQYPDTLEIAIEAHAAFARWNEAELLSVRGEVFSAADAGELPRFTGPEGAGPTMLAAHAALAAALAPLGSPIAELALSPRGAWQVRLASGLALELGRGDIASRARRFARAWPQVAQRAAAARYADLRYPNGFALDGPAPAPAADGKKKR